MRALTLFIFAIFACNIVLANPGTSTTKLAPPRIEIQMKNADWNTYLQRQHVDIDKKHEKANQPQQSFVVKMMKKGFKKLCQLVVGGDKVDKSISFTNAELTVLNTGGHAEITKGKTRGQTSIEAPRKSLSINLKEKIQLFPQNEVSKFNLVSMWEDSGYVTSQLGHKLYNRFGLFPLQTAYVELIINGTSQGLYLAMEKPKKVLPAQGANFIIRRGYFDKIEIKYLDKDSGITEEELNQAFKDLKAEIKNNPSKVSEIFNIKRYMQWLALNYFVTNGDYDDEVMFYGGRLPDGRIYFDVAAWDLDGIFSDKPHWGIKNSLPEFIGGKMGTLKAERNPIYSYNAGLDRAILGSQILNQEYLSVMDELLDELTPSVLRATINNIQSEVEPFWTVQPSINNIQQMSQLDHLPSDSSTGYSKNYVYDLLTRYENTLIQRRAEIKSRLRTVNGSLSWTDREAATK